MFGLASLIESALIFSPLAFIESGLLSGQWRRDLFAVVALLGAARLGSACN